MATEKRLIDANAISESVSGIGKDMKRPRAVELACLCLIAEAPTVDAVEVVRCKNCRFSAQHDPYDPMECMKWTTKWGVAYTTPDGHCHKGERKKDGE